MARDSLLLRIAGIQQIPIRSPRKSRSVLNRIRATALSDTKTKLVLTFVHPDYRDRTRNGTPWQASFTVLLSHATAAGGPDSIEYVSPVEEVFSSDNP